MAFQRFIIGHPFTDFSVSGGDQLFACWCTFNIDTESAAANALLRMSTFWKGAAVPVGGLSRHAQDKNKKPELSTKHTFRVFIDNSGDWLHEQLRGRLRQLLVLWITPEVSSTNGYGAGYGSFRFSLFIIMLQKLYSLIYLILEFRQRDCYSPFTRFVFQFKASILLNQKTKAWRIYLSGTHNTYRNSLHCKIYPFLRIS